MIYYYTLVVFTTVFGVDAICKFPDYVVKRGVYRKILGPGTGAIIKLTCKDPSTLTVLNTGDKAQCIDIEKEINATFFLSRLLGTNNYRCTKQMPLRNPDTGGLIFEYTGEFRKYKNTPTLCEVCKRGGKWLKSLLVADNLNDEDVRGSAESSPPLGSRVPKKCSVYNYGQDDPFSQWEDY